MANLAEQFEEQGTLLFNTAELPLTSEEWQQIESILDDVEYEHIVGGDATEMIHELVLGISMEATAEEIGKTIHAHPTLGESIMEAALDTIGERIHGA